MAIQLTAEDARQSLTAHVEGKGVEAYLKHGPHIGWEDRKSTRLNSSHT